jgi:hypothetical protein
VNFQPDIVVASPGQEHLVVEVRIKDSPDVADALKHYMLRMRSPTGILVTPTRISIFRDTFRSNAESSIDVVGAIVTSDVAELQPFASGVNRDPMAFESAVQHWLSELRNRLVHGYARGVDPILAEHVMPALTMGEIRAGGPRPRRGATAE